MTTMEKIRCMLAMHRISKRSIARYLCLSEFYVGELINERRPAPVGFQDKVFSALANIVPIENLDEGANVKTSQARSSRICESGQN